MSVRPFTSLRMWKRATEKIWRRTDNHSAPAEQAKWKSVPRELQLSLPSFFAFAVFRACVSQCSRASSETLKNHQLRGRYGLLLLCLRLAAPSPPVSGQTRKADAEERHAARFRGLSQERLATHSKHHAIA